MVVPCLYDGRLLFNDSFPLANRLPSCATAHTSNEGQGSTGNEGVVYDEISESTRRQGKAGNTTTTRPGNIELKANAAYQVGEDKH